jgi:aminoglycoside 6'-N-acetyltransferase
MGTVTLRRARADDIPRLEAWDTQPHVVAATGDDDVFDWADELSRDAEWTTTLIAEEDGRPVGVVQMIDPREEETHYWGEVEPNLRAIDIWIGEPEDLGRGLGSQMMTLVLDQCFDDPAVVAVLIDPLETNVRARAFYRRMGFAEVGPRVFGNDHCLVHRLDRAIWLERRAAEEPRQ